MLTYGLFADFLVDDLDLLGDFLPGDLPRLVAERFGDLLSGDLLPGDLLLDLIGDLIPRLVSDRLGDLLPRLVAE